MVKTGTTSLTKLSLGVSPAAATESGTLLWPSLQTTVKVVFPSAAAVTTPASETEATAGFATRNEHSAGDVALAGVNQQHLRGFRTLELNGWRIDRDLCRERGASKAVSRPGFAGGE